MRALDVDETEPGLRILAEVIQAVADRDRSRLHAIAGGEADDGEAQMIAEVRVSQRDWLHGLAACPNCGLPLDARDAPDLKVGGWDGQMRYVVPNLTHRRCGTTFTLVIESEYHE